MNIKFLLIVFLVVSFAGCERKSLTKFQGVEEKRDYVSQGMKYLAHKDVKRAILSFDQAIKQDPTNPKNFLVLGEIYLRLKNYKGAIDTFSGAIRVDPNNGDAYYLMGIAKSLNGDIQGAVKALQKSIDLFLQQRNEQKFKLAVNLLKQLTASAQPGQLKTKTPPNVGAPQQPSGT